MASHEFIVKKNGGTRYKIAEKVIAIALVLNLLATTFICYKLFYNV